MSNGHRSIRLTVQFSEVFNEDFSLKLFNQFFQLFSILSSWIPLDSLASYLLASIVFSQPVLSDSCCIQLSL